MWEGLHYEHQMPEAREDPHGRNSLQVLQVWELLQDQDLPDVPHEDAHALGCERSRLCSARRICYKDKLWGMLQHHLGQGSSSPSLPEAEKWGQRQSSGSPPQKASSLLRLLLFAAGLCGSRSLCRAGRPAGRSARWKSLSKLSSWQQRCYSPGLLAVTLVLPRETEEAGTPSETAAAEGSHSLSDQADLVGHFWAKKKKKSRLQVKFSSPPPLIFRLGLMLTSSAQAFSDRGIVEISGSGGDFLAPWREGDAIFVPSWYQAKGRMFFFSLSLFYV